MDATSHAATALFHGAPPVGLDATPKVRVFGRDKLELWRVLPGTQPLLPVPVLLIPPLMVRPYIYDLQPAHSLLQTLRDAAVDTYVVDFGVPDPGDTNLRLDDYVLDYVPTCIEQTLRHSHQDGIAIVGYCMGGLFGLIHAATFADPRVRALVTIGSPVNFRKMGAITVGARLTAPVMDTVIDLVGNVPGGLSSLVFKLLSGPRLVRSYIDLLSHLDDPRRVQSFRAINHWINDMIPYPREAYRQMFHEVILGNRLRKNQLVFGGRRCDLGQVTCPVLAFAGEQDIIAPPAAVREVVQLVGSQDRQLVVAPGGHIGVMAGHFAPERVWRPMLKWLRQRMQNPPAIS